MNQSLAITRKELNNYFGSPMALIFVGVFLVITLFTFFWVDAFFARGLADVRPLFQGMPLLMIFLIGALTMRQWSEETQTGTLEILLTMPVKITQLVVGKFFAVLLLVAVALLMTFSLPITVAILGNLDLGPVIGGYLAAVLMASAYVAIGLFISSRTSNQIVALILTVIVCGLFYLVGTTTATELVNANIGELLRAIGTGSRFESIERGVIDLRDLVYYVSLTIAFLTLNILSLDSKRWSAGAQTQSYRFNRRLLATLIILNLVVFNILLFPFDRIRLDLTASQEYTLSPVTRDLVSNLQEPLLIRGYFSEETHPLLAPLIPQVRDVLREYQIASGNTIQLEFLDPITDPELETEANQTYGIQPSPLQFSGRGGTSLVNAYLDILIRYGDQSTVISLLDLIEVTEVGGTVDVRLRNIEYDLTSNIQRIIYGFQSIDAILASLDEPAKLTLFVTSDTLPEQFAEAPTQIATIADEIAADSGGKLTFETVNLSDPNAGVDLNQLSLDYQINPIAVDIFAQQTFYLHILVQAGDKTQVIYPTGDFSETAVRESIESSLKRSSSGFLEVVGIWLPSSEPQIDPMTGQQTQTYQQYNNFANALSESYELQQVNFATGEVPSDIDALLIIGPQNLTDIDRYAIDQYLMRGGAVFVAAANYQLGVDQAQGSIALIPVEGGLQEMLASYGITVDQKLVLDTQNSQFPVQVPRNVGGMVVAEIQALDYPQFVNIRPDGMDGDSPIVASLPALTLNWVSPLLLDETINAGRTVSILARSTDNAYVTTDSNTQPNTDIYPEIGFPVEGEPGSQVLAVAITGTFSSYFADKPSPFPTAEATPDPLNPQAPQPPQQPAGFITTSPDTARLIVVGSSEFLNDNIFQLASSLNSDRSPQNAIEFMANSVDWFVQDTALSSIRSRGTSARLLDPLTENEQNNWEVANYAFALISLIVLGLIWQLRKRSEQPMELVLPDQPTVAPSQVSSAGEA